MSEEVEYLSADWARLAREKLERQLDPAKMNGLSASMVNVYRNCPDAKDRSLLIDCREGKLSRFEVADSAVPPAEFRIFGDYAVFAKITRGELSSQKALMTGKLTLKGNMAKALRLSSLADRINRILSEIPTVY